MRRGGRDGGKGGKGERRGKGGRGGETDETPSGESLDVDGGDGAGGDDKDVVDRRFIGAPTRETLCHAEDAPSDVESLQRVMQVLAYVVHVRRGEWGG